MPELAQLLPFFRRQRPLPLSGFPVHRWNERYPDGTPRSPIGYTPAPAMPRALARLEMLKRLLLVPMGILLGLVLLEGGLQVAARVVQSRTGGELRSFWLTGDLRVLCLGDSNTYGIIVPRDKPWPQQLETVWNRTVESFRIEVLNLGFPGSNSSRLVRDLPRLLETFRPDVTIIMIGVNDFWTLPFPIEAADRPRRGFVARHSKIYKLYYLMRRGSEGDELEIALDPAGKLEGGEHRVRFGGEEFAMGWSKAPQGLQGDADDLRQNLRTLVAQAEAGGTQPYLMSYPARHSFYTVTNPVIWEVTEETGTPLINLTEVFEPICPEEACPDYLLPDNHHPNAFGYQLIAETITARLSQDLQ